MKRAFLIIITAAAVMIFGYAVKRAVTPVSSQKLVRAAHEHSAAAHGYIVRDEIAYYADRGGRLYKNVNVGARVSKDSLIYTIYDSGVSDSVIKELTTIEKKIASARKARKTESLSSDSLSVESEIALRTEKIIEAGRNNDVSAVAQYKRDINSLRTDGYIISSADELQALESSKETIDTQIGSGKSNSYAANSGVFTIYYDGLEDVLNKDRVGEYTVEYIESLGDPKFMESNSDMVNQGDFVCSIVNNHVWGVLLIVAEEDMEGAKVGDTVTVRFDNIASAEEKGTISYISTPEQNKDGNCFVLVECSDYFEGAYSYRSVRAELIFERYSGYRIPANALRTEGLKHKVIGMSDNKKVECEVEVLYTDKKSGYVIVDSAEGAKHKLSSVNRIIVGER